MPVVPNTVMRRVLGGICALSVWCCLPVDVLHAETAVTAAQQEAAEAPYKKAAYRLKYERTAYDRDGKGFTVTGNGTAFGVDLSSYGFRKGYYLLSAAHNVLNDRGGVHPTIKLELRDGKGPAWTPCRVVAHDAGLDLCLLELDRQIPAWMDFSTVDVLPGQEVILAGSKKGTPVRVYRGTLQQKFYQGTVRYKARIPFDHGDSGGPFFDARSGKIVGVAVAGIPKDGDLDRNYGLFVPLAAVHSFLDPYRQNQAAPILTTPSPGEVARAGAHDVSNIPTRLDAQEPELVSVWGPDTPREIASDRPRVQVVPTSAPSQAELIRRAMKVNLGPQLISIQAPKEVYIDAPAAPAAPKRAVADAPPARRLEVPQEEEAPARAELVAESKPITLTLPPAPKSVAVKPAPAKPVVVEMAPIEMPAEAVEIAEEPAPAPARVKTVAHAEMQAASSDEAAAEIIELLPTQRSNRVYRVYTVQYGDTLSAIAQRFDIPMNELMRLNNIEDANRIYAHQRLILP